MVHDPALKCRLGCSYLRPPESLVPNGVHPSSGSLEEDLDRLGDLLEDNVPAYVLVRLDKPTTEWLAVYYVPDSAKVRDKVRSLTTVSSRHKHEPGTRCCMPLRAIP